MRHEEEERQKSMVRWFGYEHQALRPLLIHVPNERQCSQRQGARLKAMGVVAGAADLLLLVPNSQFHGLCIEVKTDTGRQRDSQKDWQQEVERVGYKYAIVRDIDQFIELISNYLGK